MIIVRNVFANEEFMMGYSTHIGRVGALAVALGIGSVVWGVPGTAVADSASTSIVTDPLSSASDRPSSSIATAGSSTGVTVTVTVAVEPPFTVACTR